MERGHHDNKLNTNTNTKTNEYIKCRYCGNDIHSSQECNLVCTWDFNHKHGNQSEKKYIACTFGSDRCHKVHVMNINDVKDQQIYFKRYDNTDDFQEPTHEYLGKIYDIDEFCHKDSNWVIHVETQASREIGTENWAIFNLKDKINLLDIEIIRFMKYRIEIKINM